MRALEGRVALVTGSGNGIGRAIARRFAAEGAIVGINDLKPELTAAAVAGIEADGGAAVDLPMDASRRENVLAAVETLASRFGRFDIMVNNAAWVRYEPITDISEKTLGRMVDIGFAGVAWGIQAAAGAMGERGGAIINIASSAAFLGMPNAMLYCGIKAGVLGLTRSAAAELGPARHPGDGDRAGLDPHRGGDGQAAAGQGRDAHRAHAAAASRRDGRHRRRGTLPRLRPEPVRLRQRHRGGWRHHPRLHVTGASARVVLITGGADGIGWATARRFAASGDSVVIADLDAATASRATQLGPGHLGMRTDVASAQDVAGMLALTLARFGRLDVLVNNAGQIDPRATPALDQPRAEFQHLLDVNLHGAFAAAQGAAEIMAARGGGAIVNLASGAGLVAVPLRNAYGASKAGVIAMNAALAATWAPHGVRVNAVAPGYVRTAIVDALERAGKVDLSRVVRRIPMGRLGRPEEIAELVFHLASPAASAVSGDLCVADGGYLAFGGTGDACDAPMSDPPETDGAPRRVVVVGTGPDADTLAGHFAAAGDRVLRGHAAVAEADVLVNVAAHPAAGGFAERVDAAITGGFLACREAAQAMLARGPGRAGAGRIVNVLRDACDPDPVGHAAGLAGIAGVRMLTRSLGCEWAGRGIRVNAVLASSATQPADLAGTVAFLASAASSYVTGSVFAVDPSRLTPARAGP